MATIFNRDTRETIDVAVIADGQDFISEVIGSANGDGRFYTETDADWEMDGDDAEWWERWAEREQRILDTADEMGEDAIEALCRLATAFGHDFELLQDKEEEYLGIK